MRTTSPRHPSPIERRGYVAFLALSLLLWIVPPVAAADDPTVCQENLTPNGPIELSISASVQAAAKASAPIKRGFFITDENYTAIQALTACGKGYHMADMWELLAVSTLNYHYNHPAALQMTTRVDRNRGAPTAWYGWVRTGGESSVANTAAVGNCANWTSTSSTEYGTVVRLTNNWSGGSTALSPWQPSTWYCSGVAPVWCVSNTR